MKPKSINMNFYRIPRLILLSFCLAFIVSCSDEGEDIVGDDSIAINDGNDENQDSGEEGTDEETSEDEDSDEDEGSEEDEGEGSGEDTGTGEDENSEDEDEVSVANLRERFVFDNNIVIENSYNTECDRTPCRTIDEDLFDIFDSEDRLPDDNYFAFSDDLSVLTLECQLNKGRRIEFKQDSDGPLTTFSQLEMEGVFFDIPEDEPTGNGGGVTIAQVHNRGASSGNKPFFRVVLHENRLETVVRQRPVVSSNESRFDRENFQFLDGEDYDGSPLRIIVGKENNSVFITIYQNDVMIVNETYQPEAGTDWIDDAGIADGFYLKGGMYNDDVDHTKNLVASYTRVIFNSNDD